MTLFKNDKYKNLAKKAKLNASTGLFFFIIRIIIVLIMNPVLIQYLGSTHFGIWKSIEKFLGFASVADGKAVQALKWTIANQEVSDDFDRKKRAVGSALLIWFLFLPILGSIITLLVFYAPDLIKSLSIADYMLVTTVFLLLGLNLILTPLFGIPDSVLTGTNNGFISNYNKIFWSIVSAILTYVALVSGYGLPELAAIVLLVTVLRGLNLQFLVKKKVSWFAVKKPEKSEVHSFFKFSSLVLVWSFIAKFLLGGEVILLSALIGPEEVSKYVFTSYLAFTAISLSAIVTSSITPGLGMLIGNKDFVKSQRIMMKLRNFAFGFSVFSGTLILLLNKSFVSLWGGETLFLGWENNLLIVMLMIQLISIRTESFLIDLTLDLKVKVLLGIVSVILSLTFSYLLYSYVHKSVSSILLGILLGRFLLVFIFPVIINEFIGYDKKWIYSLKEIFFTLILISIATFIGVNQYVTTWISLVLFGLLAVIICGIYVYTFLFSEENKTFIKNKIFKKIKYLKSD